MITNVGANFKKKKKKVRNCTTKRIQFGHTLEFFTGTELSTNTKNELETQVSQILYSHLLAKEQLLCTRYDYQK